MDEQLQYAAISFSFNDIWAGKEITVSYRFSRPTLTAIKRLRSQAAKSPLSADQDFCLDCIHADDRDKFLADVNAYPLISSSIGAQLIKAAGLCDLGN